MITLCWRTALAAIVSAFWLPPAARAAVFFDAERNVIQVTDYPAEFPCTMERLWFVDRVHGWGKVRYDEAAATYTVTAELWIGAADGTETYFQLGTKKCPRETVVLKEDLKICPWFVNAENPKTKWWEQPVKVNRLTLGDRDDKSLTASLKIDNAKRLAVGESTAVGGELCVYNSTISALRPTRDPKVSHAAAKHSFFGKTTLNNARVSWLAGQLSGLQYPHAVIEDSVFENCGAAVCNGVNRLFRCTIRDCGFAVLDQGCTDAELVDCVIQGNETNWSLKYSRWGLVLIDCTYDKPAKGNFYGCWTSPVTKKRQYPAFKSRRHVIVEVVDRSGSPIPNATVEVACEQGDLEAVDNRKTLTDRSGRTDAKGGSRPVLLTEIVEKATGVENRPEVTMYSYQFKVGAPGYQPALQAHFKPVESWQVVRLVLEK